jgi:hypothetical protein
MGRRGFLALVALAAACAPFGADPSFVDVQPIDASTVDGSTDGGTITDAAAATTDASDATADAPIIVVTGGTYELYGIDSGVCSIDTGLGITFELDNHRDASVDLIWIDQGCAEQPYQTVPPDASTTQATFVNHVWRIRNTTDKFFLGDFLLSQQKPYTVVVR